MPTPASTPKSEAAKAERLAREAEALRQNLRRRKAQARARNEPPDPRAPPDPKGAA